MEDITAEDEELLNLVIESKKRATPESSSASAHQDLASNRPSYKKSGESVSSFVYPSHGSKQEQEEDLWSEMGSKVSSEPHGSVRRSNPLSLEGEDDETSLETGDVRGNCPRKWSQHLYFKLFLDVEGRNSPMLVVKCDVTCVNVFTDVELVLYKSRFIGGKLNSIYEEFVFDLMKSDWEKRIPQLQLHELTVDVVMSSSPDHNCAESLLKLIQLEKKYLKLIKFDGRLSINVRFAHLYDWNSKDQQVMDKVRKGVRDLHNEGVNLEVMDKDAIMEEMMVDDIKITNQKLADDLIAKRFTWSGSNGDQQMEQKKNGEKRDLYHEDSSLQLQRHLKR